MSDRWICFLKFYEHGDHDFYTGREKWFNFQLIYMLSHINYIMLYHQTGRTTIKMFDDKNKKINWNFAKDRTVLKINFIIYRILGYRSPLLSLSVRIFYINNGRPLTEYQIFWFYKKFMYSFCLFWSYLIFM